MTTRPAEQTRRERAARAIGGARTAERAEQLRALGVALGKVAAQLGINPEALERYYAVQDELAVAASTWADGPLLGLNFETTGPDPQTARIRRRGSTGWSTPASGSRPRRPTCTASPTKASGTAAVCRARPSK